jgi:FkbM family methyltransferase
MIAALLAVLDRVARKSDALFVELAYRVVLGRPADPGALRNATAKLAGGYARRSFVQDLVTSEEFLDKARAAREDVDARTYDIHGTRLILHDVRGYPLRDVIVGELLHDVYGIERIPFAPGDVVVDVGGNLGAVSVYIAKKHPGVKVILYEPVPESHRLCLRNIEANGVVNNVTAVPKAVTADGRALTLAARRDFLGGASAHYDVQRVGGPGHVHVTAESVTLDGLFETHGITRCKLLKIDCEGSEHEILRAAHVLDRVEYLSGELHINAALRAQGHSLEGLREHCARFVSPDKTHLTTVTMSD